MHIVDNLDASLWRDFVDRHPNGCIFHTPEMFDVFCHAHRHRCMLLAALSEDGEILALLTSIQVQTLPPPLATLASRTVWYGEPICRPTPQGERALAEIIREHDRRVGKHVLF